MPETDEESRLKQAAPVNLYFGGNAAIGLKNRLGMVECAVVLSLFLWK